MVLSTQLVSTWNYITGLDRSIDRLDSRAVREEVGEIHGEEDVMERFDESAESAGDHGKPPACFLGINLVASPTH
jgi:hypothetical protein